MVKEDLRMYRQTLFDTMDYVYFKLVKDIVQDKFSYVFNSRKKSRVTAIILYKFNESDISTNIHDPLNAPL